jgi:hypothetical protein
VGQQFQRELAMTMATVPQVVQTVRDVEALREGSHDMETDMSAAPALAENPALADWRNGSAGG